MRAFESKNPNISSSERTKNLRSKTVFGNMRKRAKKCQGTGRNYTGTMIINKFKLNSAAGGTGAKVTNYRSYELANTMANGAALLWDNCCQGVSGPNNPFGKAERQLEGWNANGIVFDWNTGSGSTGMKYWNGATWTENELNNTVAAPNGTLDGNNVWIDPNSTLFGSKLDCKIDKFINKLEVTGDYLDKKGNNTKNNYLVGYQAIGGNKNGFGSWLLWGTGAGVPAGATGDCNCAN